MASATVVRTATAKPPRRRPARLRFAPLGVPLEVELAGSDDDDGFTAACRPWLGEADPGTPCLRLRVEVSGGLASAGALSFSIVGSALHLRGIGVEGFADPVTRKAACKVSVEHLASPDWLRSEVLDTLVLYLLAHHDRTPVHASCFLAGDMAVLLAGPSGYGKSSLALAADAAGFQVLTEDTAFIQHSPRLRVWGWPGPVHVLPANVAGEIDFPARVRNGQVKFAVPLHSQASTGQGAVSGARAVFCILERGEAVALHRLSPGQAMDRIGPPEPGFDLVAEAGREALAALTRAGAWRLTLSSDPAEAIRFVTANLAMLRHTAVP